MRIISIGLVLFARVVFGVAPSTVMGTTRVVTQCDDAGFSAALASAQPSDLITFNCGGAATIPVLSTKTLSISLTIDGANNGQPVVFSGAGARRIFIVAAGSVLELRNMTIRDGLVTGSNHGGGINNAGFLTLNNVDLRNNTADYSNGAGVYSNGALTVLSSRIRDNQSEGILNAAGTLIVRQSVISGNGTGIRINGGTGVVDQTTIDANGTAIAAFGKLTVTASTVSGSTHTGISNTGNLTVQTTTFSGNTNIFVNGGALANIYDNVGSMVVDQSTFVDNTATGGASALLAGGAVTVTNSLFARNTTTPNGVGTIVGTGLSLTMLNSTVSTNTNAVTGTAALNFTFNRVNQAQHSSRT